MGGGERMIDSSTKASKEKNLLVSDPAQMSQRSGFETNFRTGVVLDLG